jgi:hypothetical protein
VSTDVDECDGRLFNELAVEIDSADSVASCQCRDIINVVPMNAFIVD